MEITRRSVFANLIWRFLERVGAQLVSFIVSVIIARILEPEDYGIVALISVFIVILQVFVDSGLGNALIQKVDTDDIDYSTVFFTNLVFCFVIYIGLFFCAVPIANLYDNMKLVPMIRVAGISILISGVKNIQQAYVAKNLLFKKFFFSTLIGTFISAFVGIGMAYKGFGAWALLFQSLSNMIIDTIIVWILLEWRPKMLFSFSRLKQLFSFGWKLLVTGLINTTYVKLRELLIGKMYSPADLAYYNKGNNLTNLVVANIDSSIASVILPTLANYQKDLSRVKTILKRAIKTSTYILAPCLFGMAALAPNLIPFLFTDKWNSTVFYLRIFCFSYLTFPLLTLNMHTMSSLGRSDLFLKVEFQKKSVGIILLLLSIKKGVIWIAYSFLIEHIVEVFIDIYPNKKLINYGAFEQLKDVISNYIISFVMFCIINIFNYVKMNISLGFILIIQIIMGICIYVMLSVITKNDSFNYLFSILKSNIRNRKNR